MSAKKTIKGKIIGFIILFIILLIAAFVVFVIRYPYYPPKYVTSSSNGAIAVNQDTHASQGFGLDSARVDSQITLQIPEGQADAVYKYLKDKYVGQDNILKEQFSTLQLQGEKMSDLSIFTDDYYDTPWLDLYNNQNSARYRIRLNTTNPLDAKSGRELVQIKVTPPGQFDTRAELKYQVNSFKKMNIEFDDLHPFIGLVVKKERADFKKVFQAADINPYQLRKVFTLTQNRRRVYIDWDQTNILSISVDQGGAGLLWAKSQFSSIDVGLVEVAYTEADAAKRQTLGAIRSAVLKDLTDHFPELTVNTDSKYGIILTGLIQQIHAIPWLMKYNIL
ncbi:MAG: hypothetical protein V1846_02480 [Candidatus Komeilibacteria bacterium]